MSTQQPNPRHGFGPGDEDPSPVRERAEWHLAGLNLWLAVVRHGTQVTTLGWIEQSWDRWRVFVRGSAGGLPINDKRPAMAEAAERLRELLAARGYDLPALPAEEE